MTTNKNFRVKNGLEVGADGIKFADDTVMTTAATGGGTSYDQDLNTTATVVFKGVTINNTTVTTSPGNVKSLLLAEAATDEVGNTVTLNGSAAVSSTQFKYGANSFYLPGTTADYVSIANSASFNLDSSDFAIDFWLYPLSSDTTGAPTIASRWAGGSQWIIQGSGTANQYYAIVQSDGQQFVYFTVTDNAWNHIAITRFGNTLNVYVDGLLQESNTSISGSANNSTGDILLGVNGDGPQQPFNGYIDNFRLIVGDKKFDGTFTPPLANEYVVDSSTTSTTTTDVLQVTGGTVKTFVGITFADDTVMTTAPTGGGGSYDQSLNTTDSVVFAGLRVNGDSRLNTIIADDNTQKIVLSSTFTGEGSGAGGVLVVGSQNSDVGNKITLNADAVQIQNLTYPSADGTAGQVLTTDGAGVLSWASAGGGAIEVMTAAETTATSTATVKLVAISDSANKIAYYDTTNGRWNFVEDGTAVYNLPDNIPATVEYLIIGGGGSGGSNSAGGGGGGGALSTTSFGVSAGTAYTIIVGAGGATSPWNNEGYKGSSSTFATEIALGGGGGLNGIITRSENNTDVSSGGGGGGAGGIGSQGFNGGSGFGGGSYTHGGGGGGAGGPGGNATSSSGGAGGVGITSSITGISTGYAGGGGGAGDIRTSDSNGFAASTFGGTDGSRNTTGSANATANRGGGSGGAGFDAVGSAISGAGGSGVVIIRYPDTFNAASNTTGSPDITVSDGYRIYKFTATGSITF